MKEKKRKKTTIGVGSVLKEKVGEIDEYTMEGRIMRMRKEVVRCVQDVVGNKIFLFQLKYGKNKEMSSSLLVL